MTIDSFCTKYPKLMHMASGNAWGSICNHGLLSTEAIADHLKLLGQDRFTLLSQHRKNSSRWGAFTVRDQRPMDGKLDQVLDDGTKPREWLELLNGKVFLWPRKPIVSERDRLYRFLSTYSESPQLVLEFDSRRFLEKYAHETALCHINSGATRSIKHKRGRYSFVPFSKYEWSSRNEVAEVTVPRKVVGVLELVDRASVFEGRRETSMQFQRDYAQH